MNQEGASQNLILHRVENRLLSNPLKSTLVYITLYYLKQETITYTLFHSNSLFWSFLGFDIYRTVLRSLTTHLQNLKKEHIGIIIVRTVLSWFYLILKCCSPGSSQRRHERKKISQNILERLHNLISVLQVKKKSFSLMIF